MNSVKIKAIRVTVNEKAVHDVWNDLNTMGLLLAYENGTDFMDSLTGEVITKEDIDTAKRVMEFFRDGIKIVEIN